MTKVLKGVIEHFKVLDTSILCDSFRIFFMTYVVSEL